MVNGLDVETHDSVGCGSRMRAGCGRGLGPITPKKIVIAFIVFTIFAVVCASLLGSSFQYIEWDEYALKKNTASNDVEYGTIYESGRHFWGVNYKAIIFKKTVMNVNFDDNKGGHGSLVIFTDTGLEIKVLCSFQYRLIKSEVPAMFISFGNTYDQQVVSVARSILKNAAPQFFVEQYYQNRSMISQTFFDSLKSGLYTSAKVELVSFQLRHIYLAEQIVQKFLNIQVQLQVNLREQYIQTATIIRKETEARVASVQANATIILAAATSQADAIRSKASANAFRIRENARKDGLANLYQTLNFTTPEQKLSYMYSTGVASANAKLLVDTKNTLINV